MPRHLPGLRCTATIVVLVRLVGGKDEAGELLQTNQPWKGIFDLLAAERPLARHSLARWS
jgi:hypothetical protein